MADAPPVITDQDRILAVARALLEFDGHALEGIRLSAAVVEATRHCLAFATLRALEPPPVAPIERRRRDVKKVEH